MLSRIRSEYTYIVCDILPASLFACQIGVYQNIFVLRQPLKLEQKNKNGWEFRNDRRVIHPVEIPREEQKGMELFTWA